MVPGLKSALLVELQTMEAISSMQLPQLETLFFNRLHESILYINAKPQKNKEEIQYNLCISSVFLISVPYQQPGNHASLLLLYFATFLLKSSFPTFATSQFFFFIIPRPVPIPSHAFAHNLLLLLRINSS